MPICPTYWHKGRIEGGGGGREVRSWGVSTPIPFGALLNFIKRGKNVAPMCANTVKSRL